MKKSFSLLTVLASFLISSVIFANGPSKVLQNTLSSRIIPAFTSILPMESAAARELAGDIATKRFIPALIISPGAGKASMILGDAFKIKGRYETGFFRALGIGVTPPNFYLTNIAHSPTIEVRKKALLDAMSDMFLLMKHEDHVERNVYVGIINILAQSQTWLSSRMISYSSKNGDEANTVALEQFELIVELFDFITSPEAIASFQNGEYSEAAVIVESAIADINAAFLLSGDVVVESHTLKSGSETFITNKVVAALHRFDQLLALHSASATREPNTLRPTIEKMSNIYARLTGTQSSVLNHESPDNMAWAPLMHKAVTIQDVSLALSQAEKNQYRIAAKTAAQNKTGRSVPHLGGGFPASRLEGPDAALRTAKDQIPMDPLDIVGYRVF